MKSFVLAFDFGGTKMAIATATPDREILERVELSTVECGDGPTALEKALSAGRELVERTKQSYGGELAGVGISTMGITHADRVEMAPNVPGWDQLHIPGAMQAAFPGVPIRIDNDVKAAALAEVRRGALQGKDYGIYVNMGTGIAITFTLGDRVLQGHNGASGEVAYFLRSQDEKAGYHQGVAPFEEHCGGKGIGDQASKHFGEPLTAKQLYARAATDEAARKFLDDRYQEIAFHLINLVIAWDPEIVVFGGGMAARNEEVLPYLRKRVEQFVPYPPQLVLARFESDAGLYGAIELALGNERKTR
ncbi:ROK family protein [Cohnella pontilimi]|nr:ROK family protein [Cohnella pontilimi]